MNDGLAKIAGLFLEGKISDIQPLSGGLINSTYRVQTKDNQFFVLQKINTNVFPDPWAIQENMFLVGEFLTHSGYAKQICIPLALTSGKTLHIDAQQQAWRMLPFVENTDCYQSLPKDAMAQHAASALGEFHRFLAKFPLNSMKIHLPEFTNFDSRLLQWEKAVKGASSDRLQLAKHEVEQVKSHAKRIKQFVRLQENLPLRIIHGDPKLSNFLFEKNGTAVVAFIDWDTLMPGSVLYDFGDMVRSFCNTKGEESISISLFNSHIYSILKTEYLKSAVEFLLPLESEALDFAAAAVIAVQALRFLTDFLNGDVYYHVDYPMQNLERAQNQLQLLEEFLNFTGRSSNFE